ncbi:LOW QUALITY PROTEIN: hypothetical protein HJC23_012481 [Cyclotella cryptica]|uniref:Uncharacterized protein n=1 Tax=Cyclotella cryptica TaxID=29204 RepID=A0ABD3PBE7_9STRA
MYRARGGRRLTPCLPPLPRPLPHRRVLLRLLWHDDESPRSRSQSRKHETRTAHGLAPKLSIWLEQSVCARIELPRPPAERREGQRREGPAAGHVSPAAPSSTGPPRFPEGSFNRSMLAPADQVLSSNTSTNQEQDPHIALLLRQGALANLNETRPAPAPPASTAVASLLSLLQNNQGAGSIGTPSAAPFNLFGNSNPAPAPANHTGTSVLDALVQNVRQQQAQQGLPESHHQDWQQQQQIQQMRVRHLIDQWLAQARGAGDVPQALGSRPAELQQNLGPGGDQGAGLGLLQSLGLGQNNPQKQENQYREEEEEAEEECPSDCGNTSDMNASPPVPSDSQEQSRLKKKKKAHFLLPGTGVVDSEDTSATGDDESSVGCRSNRRLSEIYKDTGRRDRKRSRAKQDYSNSMISPQKPSDDIPQSSASPSPPQQTSTYHQELQYPHQEKNISIIDSADNFCNHLVRITSKRNLDFSSLKNHFGVQCMIREWIALAFSRRSFGYLAKASQMALKFGISMNRILSGVDEDGLEETGEASLSMKTKEKSATGYKKYSGDTKVCIGGKMNYLLGMFLEPRSVQAHPISERHMLVPRLDPSFLARIAPPSCSTFEDMDVRGRWIIIQETYRGETKFYCSPMIERNVMCWTHMSQIYEDNVADIFSLIFSKDQFDRFQSYLARQVSLRHDEGTRTRPVHAPMMEIRLFSKNWGETDYDDEQTVVTKEMVGEAVISDFPTRNVDMMLASIQTMDKHLVYMEFFDPQDSIGNHSNPRRIVTPDPSVPPTYAGTFPHLIF